MMKKKLEEKKPKKELASDKVSDYFGKTEKTKHLNARQRGKQVGKLIDKKMGRS